MKKLNNGGWGMIIFLILLALLFCSLLLAAYLANQYDNEMPSKIINNYIILK